MEHNLIGYQTILRVRDPMLERSTAMQPLFRIKCVSLSDKKKPEHYKTRVQTRFSKQAKLIHASLFITPFILRCHKQQPLFALHSVKKTRSDEMIRKKQSMTRDRNNGW